MKKAVHFGAGNIGRGFIAPVLQENEYEVTFVDINNELIQQINNLNQYKKIKSKLHFYYIYFAIYYNNVTAQIIDIKKNIINHLNHAIR